MNILKYLLVFFKKARIRLVLKSKIRLIKKGADSTNGGIRRTDDGIRHRHSLLWRDYNRHVNYNWLDLYVSVSGKVDHRFIPENVYYTSIEPRLNNRLFSKAWTDKNFYDLFIGSEISMPGVVLRCIDGVIYSGDRKLVVKADNINALLDKYDNKRLIIKPSVDSGGGRSVRMIIPSDRKLTVFPAVHGTDDLKGLIGMYGNNFIIQFYIEQHPWFAQFNSSSVNTIRVLTYRRFENENIIILHRLLRTGRSGSVVDNQSAGGTACAVDAEGHLASFGVDKTGARHAGTDSVRFAEAGVVPFIDEIDAAALKVASHYMYSRLLGLDFAVDENGKVILIEVNDSNNEINFYQMASGPLFGNYTEEVAEYCKTLPEAFLIDYYI